jgi:hypothetical protein
MSRIEELEAILREEIATLRRWADESQRGWSTHQVQPMRERANHLALALCGVMPEEIVSIEDVLAVVRASPATKRLTGREVATLEGQVRALARVAGVRHAE